MMLGQKIVTEERPGEGVRLAPESPGGQRGGIPCSSDSHVHCFQGPKRRLFGSYRVFLSVLGTENDQITSTVIKIHLEMLPSPQKTVSNMCVWQAQHPPPAARWIDYRSSSSKRLKLMTQKEILYKGKPKNRQRLWDEQEGEGCWRPHGVAPKKMPDLKKMHH